MLRDGKRYVVSIILHWRVVYILSLVFTLAFINSEYASAQTLKTLYTFSGGADGDGPWSGLLIANNGLYGTTLEGGLFRSGTVFRLNAGGENAIYSFEGSPDGLSPYGGVFRDNSGNLYGVTLEGGSQPCSCGTVFEISPPKSPHASWQETVLHNFDISDDDGWEPHGPLVMDALGNLFGTTAQGGSFAYGTVFTVDTTGTEQVLYNFGADNWAGGVNPADGLILDPSGNLYGTAPAGGSHGNGVVFEIDSGGTENALHDFRGKPRDGRQPIAGLIRDHTGNLFGTTEHGGAFGDGAIFGINSNGKEALLYSFTGGEDGGLPQGG